jgi:predicted nucleotidyltransferase component of viral defense system
MSAPAGPKRLWGDAYTLSDLLEQMGGGLEFAVRDFALLTLAGQLSARFPSQLIFKGGFVLRHVHGMVRFSEDIDATRHAPPGHPLDADDVAGAIRDASVGDIVRFSPQRPATDSIRSLDFDHVKVTGSMLPDTEVQVEISYREGVVDPPVPVLIGRPFYEDFEALTMAIPEMAAEKLRALAQRVQSTDLADLAEMMARKDVHDEDIARLALAKFELVRQGAANRAERIERHLLEMGADYDDTVPGLFPGARPYREALEIVWPRVRELIP